MKIGTICDNYKVEMFLEEFKKAGIIVSDVQPFGDKLQMTLITCLSEQRLVKPIVDKVTQYFIDKYKKQN